MSLDELQSIVTGLSTRMLGVRLDDLPAVVADGLGELCEHFGADRAYALKVDRDFVFELNVEWWAPGVERRTTPVADLPIEAQRFWARTLRSGNVVHIPDVAAADEAAPGAIDALRHDGVRSILFLPLVARGRTVGFLGFEARRSTCRWSEDAIQLMRTVGELFVSAVERGRAEQALEVTARELERRNEELERSNRELEQFASIVSHDLKSPLQVVRGFIELLGNSPEVAGSDRQTYVEAALRGAERMDQLIDNLLAYSRAGQRPASFGAVDLNQLMREVIADSATSIGDADAAVTFEQLPVVQGDPTQLHQLLQNLLSNAVKFRRVDVPAEVHVDASDEGSHWLVRVRDNGIGVDPAHREEIFGMFSRVHGVDRPGSGIGLAVCARVVANHGGRIWVEDGDASGTTFCFTLAKQPAS